LAINDWMLRNCTPNRMASLSGSWLWRWRRTWIIVIIIIIIIVVVVVTGGWADTVVQCLLRWLAVSDFAKLLVDLLRDVEAELRIVFTTTTQLQPLASWQGGGREGQLLPTFYPLRKCFLIENFFPKCKIWDWNSPILGELRWKIETSNTHISSARNLQVSVGKSATSCPQHFVTHNAAARNFQKQFYDSFNFTFVL